MNSSSSAKYRVADGCIKSREVQVDVCLASEHSSNVAVHCCAGSMEEKNLKCSRDGCKTRSTFAAAQNVCEERGMRLCSVAELESGVCCNKGCGWNFQISWTSDMCETRSPTLSPSNQPSPSPSSHPTSSPSASPSNQPSSSPSSHPTTHPSSSPSKQPSIRPTPSPSNQPTPLPTSVTSHPSSPPTSKAVSHPSPLLRSSLRPSFQSTVTPSSQPTTIASSTFITSEAMTKQSFATSFGLIEIGSLVLSFICFVALGYYFGRKGRKDRKDNMPSPEEESFPPPEEKHLPPLEECNLSSSEEEASTVESVQEEDRGGWLTNQSWFALSSFLASTSCAVDAANVDVNSWTGRSQTFEKEPDELRASVDDASLSSSETAGGRTMLSRLSTFGRGHESRVSVDDVSLSSSETAGVRTISNATVMTCHSGSTSATQFNRDLAWLENNIAYDD